jgi:hypothetical protein
MLLDEMLVDGLTLPMLQRSMAGTRDTEMAVGGWQPAFPVDQVTI